MKPNGIPETDAEADALRAYLPDETLAALGKLRDEEYAEHEKSRRKMDEAYAEIAAIKERMRKDRLRLKKLEAIKREYYSKPLFERLDAAREAAWILASKLRAESLARGEPQRSETVAECGIRQKAAAVCYTP